MRNREHDIESQADNTCAWLLKHENFLGWLAQQRGLLWVRGKPGAGKSTLLKYALQETRRHSLQNRLVVASFFFHGRGAEIQKTPEGLFRSLLHQLLERTPNILSELNKTFNNKVRTVGEPKKEWEWHPRELQDLLTASLAEVGKAYTVRIFVDALDECGEPVAVKLAEYFQKLVSSSGVVEGSLSICFSCRHYPVMSIKSGFEICVEDENDEDIKTYITDELHHSIGDERKVHILQQEIITRASGSFQWVTLVLSQVLELYRRRRPLQTLQTHIQKTPAELTGLYRELLNSIEEDSISQSLQLMQWICFAIRPLTLDELRYAMAVDADSPYKSLVECRNAPEYVETNEDMEYRLKDLCKGLAEVKQHENKRVVQFIQQSVNDFLVLDGLRTLDSSLESKDITIGRAHFRLSRSCLKYIDMEEIGRWVDGMASSSVDGYETSSSEAIDLPSKAFGRYAAKSWILQSEVAKTKGILQRDLLNFLQWPSNEILRRCTHI